MNTRTLLRSLVLALAVFSFLQTAALAQPKTGGKKDKKAREYTGDIKNLVPEKPLPNVASYIPKAGETGVLDPRLIHFTQNYISQNFRDNKTVADLVAALKSGKVKADAVPPLRIFEHEGALWSLDNRRLFCFKAAGLEVRVVRATPEEVLAESYKYSTNTHGISIEVRGVTDGPIDPSPEASGLKESSFVANPSTRLRDALLSAGRSIRDAIDPAKAVPSLGARGATATDGLTGLLARRIDDAKDGAKADAR